MGWGERGQHGPGRPLDKWRGNGLEAAKNLYRFHSDAYHELARVVMELHATDLAAATVEPLATYLGLKAQIAALEAEATEAKRAVCEMLGTEHQPVGKKWEFPGVGVVAVTKGRRSEKLNRAKLAKAGVSAEVLDACTEVSEGDPVIRITADEGDE